MLTKAQVHALEKKEEDDMPIVKSIPLIPDISAIRILSTSALIPSGRRPSNILSKTPITAADFLIDRVLAFFAEQSMVILRILTDCNTGYCGRPENHVYQLYLVLNYIEHSTTSNTRIHQGKMCYGPTPMQTLIKEKGGMGR